MAKAKQQGVVHKIYRLETEGAQTVLNEIGSITTALEKLKKAKLDVNNTKAKLVDPKDIADASAKVDAITRKQAELTSKSASAFQSLIKNYRDAKGNVQNLAAEFGVESEQVKIATASLREYESQWQAIKNLTKTPQKQAPVIPMVDVAGDNLIELNKEVERTATAAGTAVSELEIQEAQAANAATAWVESQVLGTNSLDDLAEATESIKIPLQEYTGSLSQNIKQNISYLDRLKQITKEKKLAGADTARLAKEEVFLKKAAAETSQTINAQVKFLQAADGSMDQLNASLGLARNLFRQLSVEEKASPFGQKLAKDIQAMDANLKTADASIGNHFRKVGDYGSAFTGAISKTFGFLKNIAYILPGIGIAGILGLLTDQITNLFTAIFTGTKALDIYSENLKNLNEVSMEANKQAGAQLTTLKLLYDAATNANTPLQDRLEAVKGLKDQFPEYFKGIDQEVILNGKAKKSYDELATSIKEAARASAARNKIEALESQRLDLEDLQRKTKIAGANQRNRVTAPKTTVITSGGIIGTGSVQTVESIEEQKANIDKNTEKNLKSQQKLIDTIDNQVEFLTKVAGADNLVKTITEKKDAKDKKDKPFQGSRLTGETKDDIKELETERLRRLAVEEKASNEIQKLRELTFDEERDYLLRIEKINADAINKKIAYLEEKKSLNAEEALTLAEFGKELSGIQLQTSKKVQDIEKRMFAEQESELKNQLEKSIQDAKNANDIIQENINATPSEKVQAQLDADKKILDAEEQYYSQLLKLNADYNDQAIVQALKAVDATKKIIALHTKELSLSTLTDIDKQTEDALTNVKLKYDKLRDDILKSNKSKSDKNAALSLLDRVENVEISGRNQVGLNDKVLAAQKLLDAGLITLKQYEQIYAAATKGQQDLNAAIETGSKNITTFGALLQSKLGDLFGFAENSDKSKLLGQTITSAFDTATDAMNTFFDLEEQRIQQSLNAQTLRLDKEEEIRLSQSQSQAETAALQKQFQIEREALERAAFEKHKKIQLQQAKINLATQLSNLAVIAFAPNPQNILTLGLAGAAMYAVQAALAIAGYALNVNRIKSAQFEKGGTVPTKKGGQAKGPSHAKGGIPFNYEAEGQELFIINKKSANDNKVRTFRGTNKQVASLINELGGGVSFARGATHTKFAKGGYLGDGLQAPVFVPSSSTVINNNNTSNSEQITELISEVRTNTTEVKNALMRLEVVQKTSTVSDALRKEVKQNQVGTL